MFRALGVSASLTVNPVCAGPFDQGVRTQLTTQWMSVLSAAGITTSPPPFRMASVIGDPLQLRTWQLAGLPSDGLCEDNALIVHTSQRWPLMIDPQKQAYKWVVGVESAAGLVVCNAQAPDLLTKVVSAVEYGFPILIEGVGEDIDPALDPLLFRQVFTKAGQSFMQLGASTIPYHKSFRLYMVTYAANPQYAPEVAAKVTLMNFIVTPVGLTQQLLTLAVKAVRPDLEDEKSRLIATSATNQKQLRDIEFRILNLIASKVCSCVWCCAWVARRGWGMCGGDAWALAAWRVCRRTVRFWTTPKQWRH